MKKILLVFGMTASVAAVAQIPNNSFETWTSQGNYSDPDEWGTLNALTSALSVFTADQGSPGVAGSYYLQLTSKTVASLGVAPGVAVTGAINTTTYSANGGFAFTQRPAQLTGSWQYMAMSGTDQGFIQIMLSRWNSATSSRDTIAFTSHNLAGMAMSWQTFSINLNYLNGNTPDTAQIVLSASKLTGQAANNSYLYVDNLAFSGTVIGVPETDAVNATLHVMPNPAHGQIRVDFGNEAIQEIRITDITGKTVYEMQPADKNSRETQQIDLHAFAPGVYFVNVRNDQHNAVRKIVVN